MNLGIRQQHRHYRRQVGRKIAMKHFGGNPSSSDLSVPTCDPTDLVAKARQCTPSQQLWIAVVENAQAAARREHFWCQEGRRTYGPRPRCEACEAEAWLADRVTVRVGSLAWIAHHLGVDLAP